MHIPAPLSPEANRLKERAEALQILLVWADVERDAGNDAPARALKTLLGKTDDRQKES
jgi:hypothetical protein